MAARHMIDKCYDASAENRAAGGASRDAMLPAIQQSGQVDKVLALQREMLKLPQLELQTEHYFAGGMYCRVVRRQAGALIVGKVHKKEHLYIVASGRVRVTNGDAVLDAAAGDVIVSKPGTKRAVLALEDSVCMTVHRTDSTDLAEIEAELIEPDALALYDSHNRLLA